MVKKSESADLFDKRFVTTYNEKVSSCHGGTIGG